MGQESLTPNAFPPCGIRRRAILEFSVWLSQRDKTFGKPMLARQDASRVRELSFITQLNASLLYGRVLLYERPR